MGRRNLDEEMKVTKMKMVPTTEKQEAILSVVSRAESWDSVRGIARVSVARMVEVNLMVKGAQSTQFA